MSRPGGTVSGDDHARSRSRTAGTSHMRAAFAGLAWLHEVRSRVWAVTEDAGLDLPSRWRGLHAVHEATVLACEVVDDAVPLVAGRHASHDDRVCTIDAVATVSGLRATIDLPAGVDVDPTRGGRDALRFVRLFSDDVAWSFGPDQRRLTVVVRSEALAVTR